jgi:HEAT repeat protein
VDQHTAREPAHTPSGKIRIQLGFEDREKDFIGVVMESYIVLLDQLSCGEDDRAEEALSHLSGWGHEIIDALQERLSSLDVDVRWWAVRALAEIDDGRVPGLLVNALSDPDQGVRWCAGLALRQHPADQAIPTLISLLADENALTRRLAGDALAATGGSAVPQLIEIAQSTVHLARLEAIRALTKIGDERAIPTLFEALDDASALIEYWASEGLEKMGVGMVFYKPG